ncbi:PTS glucose transporter subunit IIA, partial [Clostridioides difficile]|uniref:PTS glucose transporter subunit IIA n=1 Tax=Clostridioides difficile TaxID=1496 RepID=UPI001CA575B4
FDIFVSPGDKIKRGDKLISFNSKLIKEEGLQDVVIMVVTNSEQYKNIKYHIGLEAVIDDTIIAEI